MEPNEKRGLTWVDGGSMIAVAVLFDGVILVLDLLHFIPVIGTIAVFTIAWIPSLFAFLTFSLWLAIKGEASLAKIAILIAPFTAGCIGVTGWTATIWPLMAKTIAA